MSFDVCAAVLLPWQHPMAVIQMYSASGDGMLWRVRNSRGLPLNAPAAFIHPCQWMFFCRDMPVGVSSVECSLYPGAAARANLECIAIPVRDKVWRPHAERAGSRCGHTD